MSLADMSTERASTLITFEVEAWDFGMIESKVVVALPVLAKVWVILER
jgi:hypothetical protein